MFDFVNRKKRIVQIIMGLAVLPFLFWGVESYRNTGQEGYVAIVDGEEIPRREYEQALRDHQERMRAMMGANVDSAMLDSFEIRNSVLERLIQQRLLQREAINNGFIVLDSQLVKTIREIPAFQKDSKFSKQQYEDLLKAQGLTPRVFESRVRQELLLQQLLDGYSEYGFAPKAVAERVKYLSEVKREINQYQIDPEQFIAQVAPDEENITAYYEKYKVDFDLPEQVRVEYVILSLDAVAKNETVSDEAVNDYFSEHKEEFSQPEERRASHILISLAPEASDDEKQSAQEKAQQILEQIRRDPEQFAQLAEEHSNDPGSAPQGGDLGFFGRGVMVKPFEDKIFSMQLNEVSDIVATDFGLHVIKLTDIKEAKQQSLDEVREQIENKLKLQMVANTFGEIVEDFRNVVYEQGEDLQAVAKKFELTLEHSDWISRNVIEPPVLANDKLLSALFSEEVIANQSNTEAVEVAPDTFVAARVTEHKPATAQSLSVVKDQIVDKLKVQMAQAKAVEQGEKKLERLQAGDHLDIDWTEAKQISYMQSQGLDHETLRAIFKVQVNDLPTYVGAANPSGGFTLTRINKIIEPESSETLKLTDFNKQLQQMITQEEMSSYLTVLRKHYEVKVKQDTF
ncbi:peptidylprolyl isomerase [Nitrosomonas sp. JL21]|uniref:SurA N-terminal domain-containing protein n=1 Tax=Nitrosomonas sp. JL21 TaxID=153949 RepID=UPI00136F63E0|nr:SurA N-terminal domain-containing protein [Nitrosomonas sp.]MCC7090983.1 SurA N-terminal domain-containing protein [Nitrosomonas sp.]MXS77832.1 peptidylprolyl isomerase [Nitrosomonas sp. JL21]